MFVAIETTDIARAEAFYTNALGMKRVMRISRPQDPYIKDAYSFSGDPLAAEPLIILVQHNDRKTAPPPTAIELGVRVADTHAAAAKVRAAGYAVLREPPPEDHGAKLASIAKDPDGNTVELVQLDIARLR
jgi:lactoylglutathione lyase